MPAANTQDLIIIKEINGSTLVLQDGSLRQVILVGGVNVALKSEAEQNAITEGYRNFLNGLDFSIQTVIHSRKINIEKYLTSLEGRKHEEISPLLQSQIAEYEEFVRSFVQDNPIMRKLFLVVVPFTPLSLPKPESFTRFIPFIKKPDEAAAAATDEASFKEYVAQLSQRVDQVISGIQAIGLEATVLRQEELIELFYNFYNPETIERVEVVPKANT